MSILSSISCATESLTDPDTKKQLKQLTERGESVSKKTKTVSSVGKVMESVFGMRVG